MKKIFKNSIKDNNIDEIFETISVCLQSELTEHEDYMDIVWKTKIKNTLKALPEIKKKLKQ